MATKWVTMEDRELLIRIDERLKVIETAMTNHLVHHQDHEKSMHRTMWALVVMIGTIIGKSIVVWCM